MTYRPEIDGLRVLAIIPVLFFHSSISFMPGGFVGFDIFFVISGFLISSIIFAEINMEKEDYLKRSKLTLQIIEEIKKNVEIDVIKTSDIFCDDKLCKLKIDGNLLYFDDNHLSLYGADIVSKKILNELIAK